VISSKLCPSSSVPKPFLIALSILSLGYFQLSLLLSRHEASSLHQVTAAYPDGCRDFFDEFCEYLPSLCVCRAFFVFN
jgi:hypothetical protein